MADYIERKEVLELIGSFKRDDVTEHCVDYAAGWNEALEQIESNVEEDIPAADVRPERYGEWVDHNHNTSAIQCTACENVFESAIFGHAYCPICGAKMGGKEGDSDV